MEPKGSLPHWQVPATCTYPEPARSSPYPHIPLLEEPSEYYPPICAWVSSVVSFPQVSPPKPCIRLSPPQYAPYAPPISFFLILSPAQYWVNSVLYSTRKSRTCLGPLNVLKILKTWNPGVPDQTCTEYVWWLWGLNINKVFVFCKIQFYTRCFWESTSFGMWHFATGVLFSQYFIWMFSLHCQGSMIFNPWTLEDEGSVYLQNIGRHQPTRSVTFQKTWILTRFRIVWLDWSGCGLGALSCVSVLLNCYVDWLVVCL